MQILKCTHALILHGTGEGKSAINLNIEIYADNTINNELWSTALKEVKTKLRSEKD